MTASVIHRVTELDLRVDDWRWPFADDNRTAIAAHWAAKQAERPALWNGRVLLGRNAQFTPDRLRSDYFETDFASFLAWRDWGFPDKGVFNGFGMGALRASDSAFVLAEMGAHTANAGRVYFASGTPDLSDVRGARLDIPASVIREVEEETGLGPADYRAAPYWDCVVAGSMIAMMRLLQVDMAGDAVCARIIANLARQSEPELRGVRLVRSAQDFTAAMPGFVTDFMAHILGTPDAAGAAADGAVR